MEVTRSAHWFVESVREEVYHVRLAIEKDLFNLACYGFIDRIVGRRRVHERNEMAMPTALGRDEEVFAALYLALDRRCLRVRAQWIEKLVVGIAPQDGEALLPPHICIQENISFIRGLLPL